MNATEEQTPEPLSVMISHARCPKHGFNFVSVPRDSDSHEETYFKCPLKKCPEARF